MITARTYDTPAGDLAVLCHLDDSAGTDEPVVIAAGFCPIGDLVDRLPDIESADVDRATTLAPLDDVMARYLAGEVAALDDVTVDQPGTELQQTVWSELRAIPAGETRTYSELAGAAGRPRAVRAIGSACGRNLIAPFVPCHRALRRDGSLGGYYYGLDVKRWLLAHEAGQR